MEEERKVLQEEGENIIPITHETCVIDDDGNTLIDKIGDVSLLNTNSRNLVGAINEVFSDTIKQQIIDALINSGIEVNEGESWATIIDKIKGCNGGEDLGAGLDIISATELPATGKENQICVITDNPVDNYIISTLYADIPTTTDNISFYIGNSSSADAYYGTRVPIINNNVLTYYYFVRTCQGENRLNSYYYSNNMWNELTRSLVPMLEAGYEKATTTTGNLLLSTSNTYWHRVEGEQRITCNSSNGYNVVSFSNKIDFTKFNTLEITANVEAATIERQLYVGCTDTKYSSSSSGQHQFYNLAIIYYRETPVNETKTIFTFDITNWDKTAYLSLVSSINTKGKLFIYDISLY